MANGELLGVFRDVHTLFHVGTCNGLTDAQLLDRFKARSDQESSEAAFAGLLARHGPMVLGVCRRALCNPEDVADAFQATFLILVRKADSVRVDDSLGRWLFGVSRRVSVRAKLAAARRSGREVRENDAVAAPAANADLGELRNVLDEEISRLPEKLRLAVVLCELEGSGQDEAARQLGCAVGTVKSRLSCAREKLRARLVRRGVAPAAWAMYAESTSAAVPPELIEQTLKAAAGSGVISPAVTLLLEGVVRAMFVKKLSMIAITVVAGLALASGAGVMAHQAATLPAAAQPREQLALDQAQRANASGNDSRSTAADRDEGQDQEDDLMDRIETLRLDIDLLAAETLALKSRIDVTNSDMIQTRMNSTSGTDQPRIESLRKSLEGFRKEYISKSKELTRKRQELLRAQQRPQKQSALNAIARRRIHENDGQSAEIEASPGGDRGTNRGPIQSAAPDAPSISPILEKRLSRLEGKLDSVLKALEDLKRGLRQ